MTLANLNESIYGHFLGSRGPEAAALGYYDPYNRAKNIPVEVGGAQLAYEMGILGLVLMPIIILTIIRRILKLSKHKMHFRAIVILLTFNILLYIEYFTKSHMVLNTTQMQTYLFWAIPGICASLIEIGGAKLKIKDKR